MAYSATIIADSVSLWGDRLTTMVVTFPRFVLAELNTHRMFSRNSASSRAIPVKRQLEMLESDPFVPFYWGKNQPGMQAAAELDESERLTAELEWRAALDDATVHARRLLALDAHKQLPNRLLEPFMWHTTIITATEWNNFFALRTDPDAQPEIQRAAELMRDAYEASSPTYLREGQWHLPLLQDDERGGRFERSVEARQISAARCARVSYRTHAGRRDTGADLALYGRLVTSGHLSPLEHVATPFTPAESSARQAMADQARSSGLDQMTIQQLVEATKFNGNFRGWTQLRKTIFGEDDFSLA